jgi:hypothetical protein
MNSNKIPPPHHPRKVQPRWLEEIKLGNDVHNEKYVVVMKIDGSAPERAKRFTPE